MAVCLAYGSDVLKVVLKVACWVLLPMVVLSDESLVV